MPSLYHFNSDQFKENLMLGGQQHMVAGRLCQYLKGWQLDGIRFLYKHFEKGEACILNDESGLGKVVTVAVFLGAILTNDTTKKCLIIVPDDEHIEGWRFHLSVLTQLRVKVIERTSDINYETVFLIKWSTLKNIGQITKITFDHIIIDNRGEMLTNKFCTGILLRYYENKTSIVISSADVTADIKLLHILLRLCGRLDKQYADVKTFEDKFQLPKLKDGVSSKIDLEDYFLKREKVINFCRDFRLRRYCHQFDEEFPLVPSSEFKRHLERWRSSDNSQSSGSVKLLSSSSEKDIEELFQEYFQVKQERDSRKLDCEVQEIMEHMAVDDDDPDVSDEVVIMSPLLFVSESESDSEQTGVQIDMSSKLQEDIKDEEEIVPPTIEKEIVKSRKSKTPVRRTTRNQEELGDKKSLRSRKVPNNESPLPEQKKNMELAQNLTDDDTNTSKKRGRKPKVKVMEGEAIGKRLQDEELKKKEKRGAFEKSVTPKKGDRVETTELPNRNERRKGAKDEEKNKQDKLMEDRRKLKSADNILEKEQVDKNKAKENEKKTSPKLEKIKKTSKDEEVVARKTPLKVDRANKVRLDNEKKKEYTQLEVKLKPVKEVSSKTTPSKLEETRKRARKEEKEEEKTTNDAGAKDLIKRTRTKSEEENRTLNESEKQKRRQRQSKPPEESQGNINNEKTRLTDVQDKSKEAKEEENKRRRAKDDNTMNQHESKKVNKRKTTRPERRHPSLLLIINEANKFLNNKYNRRLGGTKNMQTMKRTRTPQKLNVSLNSTTSPSRGISSLRSLRKPQENTITSPKSSAKQKVKPDTSRRGKSLTVYAPLAVHSKSTRGMQRCTRSCPTPNKFMKVAIAQVDIEKTTTKKSTGKRLSQRRPTVPAPKTPSAVEATRPTQNQVSESPAALESMQLGQALSPSTGLIVPDFMAPPLKSVDYNFPLMLDKDIPDTECIITSVNNTNNNEIIVLTGSSTASNEMEPPKSTISRRKATIRPPMVAIPRPSYNKAKSPDLFSTCSQVSLPCSQQHTNKYQFEGFKIFGSELRQPNKQRSCLDILERIPDPRTPIVAEKKTTPPTERPLCSPQQHCIDDEDAMFEITSNGTFGNIVRVNSKGEMSPISNKGHQSTPPPVSHPKNRITNYLISNNPYANGAPPSSSLEDVIDQLPKTPKRRKSLSGTVKRSPRALSGGITGGKSQSTKLTQWLVKNAVVRISETPQKPLPTKRRRLELSFPND